MYEFVDGITISGWWAYVCTDPSNYDDERTSSDYGYSKLSYQNWTESKGGYPGKVGYDTTNTSNQLIGFPTASGGSATAGITDYYWSDSGVRVVFRGGSHPNATGAGAFFFNYAYKFTTAPADVGCRLLKTA